MAMNAVRAGIDIEQASMVGAQIKTGRQGHTLTAVLARSPPRRTHVRGRSRRCRGARGGAQDVLGVGRLHRQASLDGHRESEDRRATMEFPMIHRKELRAAIEFQAQEAIPIPLDEAILDFQVLSTTPGEEGGWRPSAGPHRGRPARHDRPVHAGREEGGSLRRRHRPPGVRSHALGRAAGRVCRPRRATGWTGRAGSSTSAPASATSWSHPAGAPQFTRVVNLGYETLVQAVMQNRGLDAPGGRPAAPHRRSQRQRRRGRGP